MNKTTLIFAGLALFAASCSETEIVSTNTQDVSESINFSAYANKLTKALQTDVTTANLTSFKVTAIGNNSIYFDNETFTKSASGVWESLDTHIWPNYALDFYAYNTPENVSEIDLTTFVHFINNGENKNLRVTPAKELANQEDFVVAKALNQTQAGTSSNENHAVNLTFKHYMTQIVVNAMNSHTENYKVEVTDVKIKNIAGTGVYTFSNDKMTAETGKTSYSASFPSKELSTVTHEMMNQDGGGKWYLVPQTVTPWVQSTDQTNTLKGAYLALKVRITTASGGKLYPSTVGEGEDGYGWIAVPMPSVLSGETKDYNYAQGKKYTIILNFFSNKTGAGFVDPEEPSDLDGDGDAADDAGEPIGGNPIVFNATVDEWENTTITINL